MEEGEHGRPYMYDRNCPPFIIYNENLSDAEFFIVLKLGSLLIGVQSRKMEPVGLE